MRERIERLAKGIVDTEFPALKFLPALLDETIGIGERVKREIYVTSVNNMSIKGLVYSSHIRVKVLNPSFGGLRNHVHFEVNTDYLEHGDQIKGAFSFITNGGEKAVPYSFRVELGAAGQTLGSLMLPKDFAGLVEQDSETALRLFEYKDFVDAPFMQNLHIRTIYDGLKGGSNRKNVLEEFLVAIGEKVPVEIYISPDVKHYDRPREILEDFVRIARVGWGYFSVQIESEADFITVLKSAVTNADFTEDIFYVPYRIDPAKLHKGKNFGSIRLTTQKSVAVIQIEAFRYEKALGYEETKNGLRKDLYQRYLSLRLDYEGSASESSSLQNQMMRELDLLSREQIQGDSRLLNLLQAELYLLSNRKERAEQILKESRAAVLEVRQQEVELYCYYQYLQLQLEQKPDQKESLIRLVQRYLEEKEGRHYLFLLLLKLDDGLYDNPGSLLQWMGECYAAGCHSPFLYLAACKLLNQEPGLLRRVGSFELQLLGFGARRELVSKELAAAVTRLAGSSKYYHKLFHRLLVMLYQKYPKLELLEAICCMLIKGDCKREVDFAWYQQALDSGVSLTRLYEYYLYSLPVNYSQLLPKEVLLYFSYEKELDDTSKSVLYQNLLQYLDKTDPMYQHYERSMEQFAMDQLFASRINDRLAVIYDHMIYKDMINERVARVLPSILRSDRIECRYDQMKYVIVCYEEVRQEDAFPLKNGVAYVPVFSNHSILLFQDAYGNRYANMKHKKTPLMEHLDWEDQCFDIYPDHPMLRLKACRDVMDKKIVEEEQVFLLENSLKELELHPLFQRKLMSRIIEFYQKDKDQNVKSSDVENSYGNQFFVKLDKSRLSQKERVRICETLIHQGYYKEAFSVIKKYGCDQVETSHLLNLCTKMIMQNLFGEDELLLALAFQVFAAGKSDSILLDYLCEHYYGTANQMVQILLKAIKEEVETYQLEANLIDQMLFSGETEKLDQIFDLYARRKKASGIRVKAYFTMKCTEYFIEHKQAALSVFTYLEQIMESQEDVSKVPVIYLLALTSHYASLTQLKESQKKLCKGLLDYLLQEKMVFAYWKNLDQYLILPDDIMGKAMIQYQGTKDSKVELQLRVLPHETEFHTEDMRRVYQGFFIKQKVLFGGESLEYRVYENGGRQSVKVEEGVVGSNNQKIVSHDKRFIALNEMGICLKEKEEQKLKGKMREYLVNMATAEELFQLM